MGKKLLTTPRSRVKAAPGVAQSKAALRRAWMRSKERGEALKRDGYKCQVCGVKQSKAKGREVKVVVHHIDGVRWTGTFYEMAKDLFCEASRLLTLCMGCHDKEHEKP